MVQLVERRRILSKKGGGDYSKQYLTFEAITNSTFSFSTNNLQYSLDNGTTWTTLPSGTASPTVVAGNKILWKQTGLTPSSSNGIGTFSATGNFEASGNIMSLYYGDNFIRQKNLTGKSYAFYKLFESCAKLINAENLVLPATELPIGCYQNMFAICKALTTAPELPATTLAHNCYLRMFQACRSLTAAPELPATILVNSCYNNMFSGCTALKTVPKLPATTLASSCCSSMFSECTSLTSIPEILPATILANDCYAFMFWGCTALTTAPELPATTLKQNCYMSMFGNCRNLTYIKCLATNISASACTSSWVDGVSATGTFVKDTSMTSWSTGKNGIPSGWTVEDA